MEALETHGSDTETEGAANAPEVADKPKKKKRGRPRKARTDDAANLEIPQAADVPVDDVPTGGAIKATGVIRADVFKRDDVPTVSVWMGSSNECPYTVVHAAGFDFPRETQDVSSDGINTRRPSYRGKLIDLTPDEITRITAAVGRKIVRKHGARSNIQNMDSRQYRPSDSDRPLGEFVYMIAVSENMAHDWRDRTPEMMA